MDLPTQNHLNSARDLLRSRLHELRSDLYAAEQARLTETADSTTEVVDRKDLAALGLSAELANEAQRRDSEEALLVEAALERLSRGTYGDCQDCGEPIPWARLQVQPAAPRCAGCQAAWEQSRSHLDAHHPR